MAALVNFVISLVPLLAIQLIVGVGIPWTVLLVPIPAFFLLMLVAGLGLLIASAAVYFYDVLDLTAVLTQLVGYLTPTFYPISIVPEQLPALDLRQSSVLVSRRLPWFHVRGGVRPDVDLRR